MRRTSSRTKTFSPFKWLLLLLLAAAGAYAALLFAPKGNGKPYTLRIAKGQGMAAVSRRRADEGIVYSRWVLLSAAYFDGSHDKLKDGSYTLKVEAAREEGGTENVAIPFTLPIKDKTEASAAGKSELGDIHLTLTP